MNKTFVAVVFALSSAGTSQAACQLICTATGKIDHIKKIELSDEGITGKLNLAVTTEATSVTVDGVTTKIDRKVTSQAGSLSDSSILISSSYYEDLTNQQEIHLYLEHQTNGAYRLREYSTDSSHDTAVINVVINDEDTVTCELK